MNELSLIICTRNRSDMIGDVLECAMNQTLSSEKYEVIIVDESTNDETAQIALNYPTVKYIKQKSLGLSNSRNEGIEASNGDIIVFVDDDVVFDEHYLENILFCFENSKLKPDFLGGKTHIRFLTAKPDWIQCSLLGILAYSDYGEEECYYDLHLKHIPYGCNMAVKRSCILKIGGFSDIIKRFDITLAENEDVIVGNRLRQEGFNIVYSPKMFLYHRMPEIRLTYAYYKKRFLSQGASDAFVYYYLGQYKYHKIPAMLIKHCYRIIESLVLRFFKKDGYSLYYQKLRLYYNAGYIKTLCKILFKRIEIK